MSIAEVRRGLSIVALNQEQVRERAQGRELREDHVSMGIRIIIKRRHQIRNGFNGPFVIREEEVPLMERACMVEFARFLVPGVARISILDMLLSMRIIGAVNCEIIRERFQKGAVELAARARESGETKLLVVAEIFVSITREYSDSEEYMNRVLEESFEGRQREGFGAVPASSSSIKLLKRRRFEEKKSGKEASCVICMEEFCGGMEIIEMPCNHIFHEDCIIGWLERSHLCPLCRFAMPA